MQISFKGDGPLGGIIAMANTRCEVKGKVGNAAADLPQRASDGKLDVSGLVGQGTVFFLLCFFVWLLCKKPLC